MTKKQKANFIKEASTRSSYGSAKLLKNLMKERQELFTDLVKGRLIPSGYHINKY